MNEMLNNWAPEVGALLTRLTAAGFTIPGGHNGEERIKPESTLVDRVRFISELTACDEFQIYVDSPDGKKLTIFCVLGNCPGELVSDYVCHPLLDEVTTAHYDEWSTKPQPMISRAERYPNIPQ